MLYEQTRLEKVVVIRHNGMVGVSVSDRDPVATTIVVLLQWYIN